ncbi:ABC transporter permease [Spiractinospora alimapuensis]|uniref:ABC transporter permease n=1 Tax=Spiractinospora alimapuensis TaxID=2820884 RepID=UPI001F3C9DAA|nr:ABC transporter permease [Spiractinospora alimapuensis]
MRDRGARYGTTTRGSRLRSGLSLRETPLLAALALAVLAASFLVENFATGRNVSFLVLSVAAIALMALPLTLIVITAEIDLSVASTLALSSAVMGTLWTSGMPMETIIVICLGVGVAAGSLNAVLVTVAGLPSLAVTIGTMALYRGLSYVLLGDEAVASYPRSWVAGARAPVPGTDVPWIAFAIAVLAVGFAVVLHATAFGRSLYAIGANPEAARFSGIDVTRTKFGLFVLSGLVSSAAGVFWTLQYGTSRADTAFGLELQVVAAVLLGGVSIFGGVGTVVGVASGVLLLGVIRNALSLYGVSSDVLMIVTGFLLVASVVAPNLVATLRRHVHRSPPDLGPAHTPGDPVVPTRSTPTERY